MLYFITQQGNKALLQYHFTYHDHFKLCSDFSKVLSNNRQNCYFCAALRIFFHFDAQKELLYPQSCSGSKGCQKSKHVSL